VGIAIGGGGVTQGHVVGCASFNPADAFILETFSKPVSWLAMEKLNLTQQKHAFTNQNKCTTTQNKQKNKARYNRLL